MHNKTRPLRTSTVSRRSGWKAALVATAALALTLTGCAAGGGSSSAAHVLNLGVVEPISDFSAADAPANVLSPYDQAVYDGLLKAAPDGTIKPSLATKWSYNSDKTVLTLSLRKDVKFSDGTSFDAEAAAKNLLRFRDGTAAAKSTLSAVKDAKAVDSSTLKITLSQSDPALLTYLTQNAGLQESPKAFTSKDIKTTPVGSGPYTINTSKTVGGSSYVFDKNPHYWNPSAAHYDQIVVKVYSDPTALLNAIQGGQVNASSTSNNNDIAQIKSAGFTVNPVELNWNGLILFDRAGTMNKALGDVRVRQAINYAFDRKMLLKALGQGFGTPTTQVFPTRSAAYDKSLDAQYPYSPAKAKQLLAEAGYAGGLTIDMPSTSLLGTNVFTLAQQQLAQVGITVKYTDAGNNFISDILVPKYAATYMMLQSDPSDWQLINFQISQSATFNPFHYDDPKADALIAKVHNGSASEAAAAAKDLNTYIVQQAWFAPWYRMQLSYVTDAHTKVTVQSGYAYPYLWNIVPKS